MRNIFCWPNNISVLRHRFDDVLFILLLYFTLYYHEKHHIPHLTQSNGRQWKFSLISHYFVLNSFFFVFISFFLYFCLSSTFALCSFCDTIFLFRYWMGVIGWHLTGMFTGYILNRFKTPPKVSPFINLVFWAMSLCIMFLLVFGVWNGSLDRTWTAIYISLGHSGE